MREGWKEVKLGDYYEVRSGLSKPASEFGSGFPFLSFKNVFNNYFLPDDLEELVNTSESERENMSIKKGDVFLTRTSETNDELGMSSVALKDYPNATFNGFCKRLRPKESNDFDPKYIGFYLRSPKFRAEIGQFANLTTRASLNNEIINRLNLIVPPLETQKKIASILSGYDDLIENNLKRIKILEEMSQQTYEEWFVRMRFPGHDALRASASVNAETGLPEGWEKVKLGDLGEIVTGKTPSTSKEEYYNGNIPFIKTPDMNGSVYVIETNQYLTQEGSNVQKNKILDKNDLVVSCIGSAGAYALVSRPSQFNQQINAIRFKKNEYVYFTFCYAKGLKEILEALGSNGATMTNVNKGKFEQIDIILPNVELLNQFHQFAKPCFESILNLQNQNQRLREARDILLPRLMMGMIEV